MGGHLVDLSDVIGRRSRDLADRIRDEPTWKRRFGILDDFLLRNSETGPRPDPRMRRAWECLVAATVPVAAALEANLRLRSSRG